MAELPKASDLKPYASEYMREKAGRDLLAFSRYCMGIEEELEEEAHARIKYNVPGEDIEALFPTRWHATPFHRKYLEIIQNAIETRGKSEKKFILISVPPGLGKTTNLLTAALFYVARLTNFHTMYMSYNEPMAEEKGADVRKLAEEILPKTHPDVSLDRAQKSKSHLKFSNGNNMYFTSITGTVAGRPVKAVFIDDPAKWDQDSGGEANLEKVYNDLVSGALSRMHSDTIFFMIHTRKFVDDPIGRFTAKDNPLSDFVEYYNFMDIIETQEDADNDPIGRSIGGLLHEEKHNLSVVQAQKAADSNSFYAMYQGKPTNPEGNEIPVDKIRFYDELPRGLTHYMISDHATSIKKHADYTVIGDVGVDKRLNIYIHPELIWDRISSERQIVKLIDFYYGHGVEDWTMEKGVIWSSLKSFLMTELDLQGKTMIFRPVATNTGTTASGKLWGTTALRGWIERGRVFFPSQKVFDAYHIQSWTGRAITEMRNFDGSKSTRTRKDDFVDFMKLMGLRLNRLNGTSYVETVSDNMDPLTRQIWNNTATGRRA